MHELGKPYRWIEGHSLADLEIPSSPMRWPSLCRKSGNGKADGTDMFGRIVLEKLFQKLEAGTGDWRGPMLKIIGSMLMRRIPVDVIVATCRRATWLHAGYTHEDTDQWVMKCIQDTRKRWETPDTDDTFDKVDGETSSAWPEPDLSILSDHRLPAPLMPLEVFGSYWSSWIRDQAEAKSCAPTMLLPA